MILPRATPTGGATLLHVGIRQAHVVSASRAVCITALPLRGNPLLVGTTAANLTTGAKPTLSRLQTSLALQSVPPQPVPKTAPPIDTRGTKPPGQAVKKVLAPAIPIAARKAPRDTT